MSIITTSTPFLLIQVIHAIGAGAAMFNAVKEGITQANDMNISFDNVFVSESKSLIEKGRLKVLFGHKIEINCPLCASFNSEIIFIS